MTQAESVAGAVKELGAACQEMERVGQYLKRGIVPSQDFVVPRLQNAEAARAKAAEAVKEAYGDDTAPAPVRPRQR